MATITYRRRSREEILAWLQQARESKAVWEKRMQKKFETEALVRKQIEDSHYYDIK